jgi:colicin import membrane protein
MKFGVTVSASLHSALIAWGLFSLSAPPPLVTLQDEGVEVDIASLEPAAKAKGGKKAEVDPKPEPEQTKRPEKIPDARNVGDANADDKSRKGEITDKPLDTVKADAAPKAEDANSAREIREIPVVEPVRKQDPVATPELANLNEPKIEIAPDAKAESGPDAAEIADDAVKLPEKPPVPRQAERPKARTPETKERKQPEEQAQKETAASTENSKNVTDRIANLLNKQKDSESGAKRQTRVASIGQETGHDAPKLTKGEYDALKGRVGQCWSIPSYVDQENLSIELAMTMSADGFMEAISQIKVAGVAKPEHESAIRSSLQRNLDRRNCDFSDVLPRDKYATWKDVIVKFVPGDY